MSVILEGLMIGDIASTEYAIKKGVCIERNPLLRNKKRRLAIYPLKLALPIILNIISRSDSSSTTKIIGLTATSGLTVFMTGVFINNLYQILRKDDKCKIN